MDDTSVADVAWRRTTHPARPREWRKHAQPPLPQWFTSVFPSEPDFADVEESITRARAYLPSQDNWDDEGAAGISDDTLLKAATFLRNTVRSVQARSGIVLPAPTIGPGTDGSIDLLWQTGKFSLLINIRAGDSDGSDFYGETPDGLKIKGTFKPREHDFAFIHWLAEQ